MGFLPASGGLSPLQNPELRKVSWKALFLLLFVAVFLLVAFFLFEQQVSISKKKQPLFDASKITFANSSLGSNFSENLKQAYASEDSNVNAKALIHAFGQLSFDYKIQPAQEKRDLLVEIYDYLKNKYPADFSEAGLVIPCLEASCGLVVDEGFTKIGSEINASGQIDEATKQAMLYELRIAGAGASEGNNVLAFNNSIDVFYGLKKIWVATKSEEIKSIAQGLLGVISQSSPELYQKYKAEKGLEI